MDEADSLLSTTPPIRPYHGNSIHDEKRALMQLLEEVSSSSGGEEEEEEEDDEEEEDGEEEEEIGKIAKHGYMAEKCVSEKISDYLCTKMQFSLSFSLWGRDDVYSQSPLSERSPSPLL